MNSSKTMAAVRCIYDWVESALWALLAAFVLYFLVFLAPALPEIARRAESIRALNVAAENRSYCERWGMKQGTQAHTLCTSDLQELRAKIKQEFDDHGSIL